MIKKRMMLHIFLVGLYGVVHSAFQPITNGQTVTFNLSQDLTSLSIISSDGKVTSLDAAIPLFGSGNSVTVYGGNTNDAYGNDVYSIEIMGGASNNQKTIPIGNLNGSPTYSIMCNGVVQSNYYLTTNITQFSIAIAINVPIQISAPNGLKHLTVVSSDAKKTTLDITTPLSVLNNTSIQASFNAGNPISFTLNGGENGQYSLAVTNASGAMSPLGTLQGKPDFEMSCNGTSIDSVFGSVSTYFTIINSGAINVPIQIYAPNGLTSLTVVSSDSKTTTLDITTPVVALKNNSVQALFNAGNPIKFVYKVVAEDSSYNLFVKGLLSDGTSEESSIGFLQGKPSFQMYCNGTSIGSALGSVSTSFTIINPDPARSITSGQTITLNGNTLNSLKFLSSDNKLSSLDLNNPFYFQRYDIYCTNYLNLSAKTAFDRGLHLHVRIISSKIRINPFQGSLKSGCGPLIAFVGNLEGNPPYKILYNGVVTGYYFDNTVSNFIIAPA